MTRSLCIDTSAGTAIALVDDQEVLARFQQADPRRHAESLAQGLLDVLAQAGIASLDSAGIDRVLVGTGPGPFTGLRAGLAFAKSVGLGLGVPVMGVWSSQSPAFATLKQSPGPVLVISDARRKEVYYAIYSLAAGAGVDGKDSGAALTVVAQPAVGTLEQALAVGEEYGASAITGPPELSTQVEELIPAEVDPALFAPIADADPGREFSLEPVYLRSADIHGQVPTSLPVPKL